MESQGSKRLRILVVDDDRATLRIVGAIVSSAGHQVTEAPDGREAREKILQDPPDIVICDWDMPEMDGLTLCRDIRLRELPKYVYFLLLTGKSQPADLVEGLAAGADDFVTKPVDRAVLLARIGAGSRIIRMERQLRDISYHDPLTGLLNRRTLHDRFADEWERARRYNHPLSCVMVDLDFFKRVNDTYGHAAGDDVLVAVGSLMKSLCRKSDLLCRYGGEEFCALLTHTTERAAAEWAERIRVAISQAAIHAAGKVLSVTASLGVAERQADTRTPEELVERADQSLAVVKRAGRNRVVRFSSLSERLPNLPGGGMARGPLDGILARDVMSVPLFCPRQDLAVRQVVDVFLQLRIHSAPVVDDSGMIVGIVNEGDLLTHTAFGEGWTSELREVMKRDVVSYEEETPIEQIHQFFARVSVPRIVVLKEGRPTGVITRSTLLRWFRNWLETREGADGCSSEQSRAERERQKAALIRTAKAAADRVAEIPRQIAVYEDDFIPCVVGEATRLQSLVNDLLGHCRGSDVH